MRMLRMLATTALAIGCGTSSASSSDPGRPPSAQNSGGGASSDSPSLPFSTCASARQLEAWQREIDAFDGGFRPTGSAAHEGYIALLAKELTELGVHDVHTEPYGFSMWTPATWSLALTTGASAGPITLSGYVPYSGATSAAGITAPIVYLPESALPVSQSALANALHDPAAATEAMVKDLRASLVALSGSLVGKIVLFDVPRVSLSMKQLTGQTLFVNDPGATLSPDATIRRTDLSAMLTMNAVMSALASAGAVGAIGILDVTEEAARGMYAPFFGTTSPNLPAVYVDRANGAQLKTTVAGSGGLLLAKLVLDAKVTDATSENVVGVLPGASDKEIILGSHTDGPNSMEDNGPVAILALSSCLGSQSPAERPRTIRIVLSGGHFIGSRGLQSYVAAHTSDLTAKAIVVIELEHLGAREWTEVTPGTMGLTGRAETQVIATPNTKGFVDASVAFAQKFPRSVVATPPLLGEGHHFTVVPVIQFLTMPEYLLASHLPAITSQLTDYELMQRQVDAFVDMELALAGAP